MLKKNKKFTLLLSGLSGALLVSSAAGVALSSCSTTSSSSSSDVQYSYVIDWNNEDAVKRLIIDDNGLVYSDSAMTTIIAVSPKVKLTTVKIPSRVKSIMGYSKVMYKDSNGNLTDSAPSTGTSTKVYQSYGAFQGMESLETVVLESGSQLQSIGAYAFNGCTTLKNISNLSSSLKYVGAYAFNGCTNLQAIDLSNVVKVDDYAFNSCTSLSTINLTNTLSIGNYSFKNCSNLTALGSLDKVSSIGEGAFYGATKSGSSIELKFSNLKLMSKAAFYSAKGITTIDFSNNTLLTSITDNAFMYSSATTVNFDGCSNLLEIGERTFEGCTSLTSVTLPSDDITSLTTIGYNAFINCKSLTTVGAKGTTTKSFVATKKISTIGANFLANTLIETVNLSNFVISSTNVSSNPFGSAASLAYIPNLSSVTLPSNIATLNAGLFYGSGLSSSTGFSLKLPSTVTSLAYSASSVSIASPNNTDTTKKVAIPNATPFTNSGLASIDMSDITSYQTTNGSTTVLTEYLFNGLTKLTSVILKTDTTEIGTYAFAGTTALTSITYPSSPSNVATAADTVNGFTASNTLTKIGANAFENAFSDDSGAVVDLTNIASLSLGTSAFKGSKIATVNLPTSTTTIPANSFENMTKLSSFNFGSLTKLTAIVAPNFNKTLLKSIDLSNITNSSFKFSNVNTSNKLFTELPVDCVVSLPNISLSFSKVFIGTDGEPVNFSYPNGLSSNLYTVSSKVLSSITSNEQLNNLSSVNLSSNTNILSIGPNTFFGGSKLTSVTLPAKGISSTTFTKGLFSTTETITANTINTATPSKYIKTAVPFGNNTALTNLGYSNFTITSGSTTTAAELFKTTSSTTWEEVAKIMNSLSYLAAPTAANAANYDTKNMSSWTAGATQTATSVINTDTTATWTSESTSSGTTTPASVAFNNSFASTTAESATSISISATDTTKTIVHNGVVWTYSNNGSTITLKANNVNMYRLKDTSNNEYIVYFNETTVTSGSNTYYVPSSQSINVTLTIATASSSATK